PTGGPFAVNAANPNAPQGPNPSTDLGTGAPVSLLPPLVQVSIPGATDLRPAEPPPQVLLVNVLPNTSPLLLQPDSPLPSLSRIGVTAPVIGGVGEGEDENVYGISINTWRRELMQNSSEPENERAVPAPQPPARDGGAPPVRRRGMSD